MLVREVIDSTGLIPIQSKNRRTLLHFARTDLSSLTVCGRYGLDRMVEEDVELNHVPKTCGACVHAIETRKVGV